MLMMFYVFLNGKHFGKHEFVGPEKRWEDNINILG
jgi:hypothetical protein